MEREIKFRCWNPNKNRFEEEFEISPDGAVGRTDMFESYYSHSDWVLMQYTGLTDKNGKPIYESDVVKGLLIYPQGETGSLPTMGRVEYSEGFGSFGLRNDGGLTLFHNHLIHTFEIIGNVHENKDLLNA